MLINKIIITFHKGAFLVRAKKAPEKETRDLMLHSLIICNYSTPSGITRIRSNKFRFWTCGVKQWLLITQRSNFIPTITKRAINVMRESNKVCIVWTKWVYTPIFEHYNLLASVVPVGEFLCAPFLCGQRNGAYHNEQKMNDYGDNSNYVLI